MKTTLSNFRSASLLAMALVSASGCTVDTDGLADDTSARTDGVGNGTCEVIFDVSSQWDAGFVANVAITNNTAADYKGWALTFTFPGDQKITSLWNGKFSQNGASVTVSDEGWNGSVKTGGRASIGLTASFSGANARPVDFRVNGVPCNGQVDPQPDPGTPDDPDPGTPNDPGGPGGPTDPGGPGDPGSAGKRMIGYFSSWSIYDRNFNISDIAAEKLTHINYAFANLVNGECALGDSWADTEKPMGNDTSDTPLRGNFHQLQLVKKAHPGLKTLISVGGWTWSGGFSSAASTAAGRSKLASSCVKFMKQYGFDGIDIDWEYPVGGGLSGGTPADKQNYTLLLAELRKSLDAQGATDGGAHYELSIAAPAGGSIIDHLEADKIHNYLDHINVMTYDFHGGWENTTNFNAPLYASANDPSQGDIKTTFNTDSAVKRYLASGVPADKLVVGMPFYGRGWQGVSSAQNGLFQAASGAAPGKYEAGIFAFRELAPYLASYTRYYSDEANVPWLYNAATGIMISYDDAESLEFKAQYVASKGLGGAMFWELNGDDAQHTLLNAVHSIIAK